MRYLFAVVALYIGLRMIKKGYDMTQDQELFMAKTMYGEARGESLAGKQAVGNVIMNRVDAGSWYGASIKDVVLKPYQFSCWNSNDPNRKIIDNVSIQTLESTMCLPLARQIIAGDLPDITGGATHYHAKSIIPSWASKMKRTAIIGNHIFYKEV